MRKIKLSCIIWDREDITNSNPIIDAEINSVKLTLMIDTGASLSFLDKEFVDNARRLKLLQTDMDKSCIVNLQGGHTEVSKKLNTRTMAIEGVEYEQTFLVMPMEIDKTNPDMVYQGILGFDFLIRNRITLDFSKFSMLIP